MNSHLREKVILLALVLGIVLFVVSKLAPQIQEFTEKTGLRADEGWATFRFCPHCPCQRGLVAQAVRNRLRMES